MFKIATRNGNNCSPETMKIPEVKGCAQVASSLLSPVLFAFITFFKERLNHHLDACLNCFSFLFFFVFCLKELGNDDRVASSIKVCLLVQELLRFLFIVL